MRDRWWSEDEPQQAPPPIFGPSRAEAEQELLDDPRGYGQAYDPAAEAAAPFLPQQPAQSNWQGLLPMLEGAVRGAGEQLGVLGEDGSPQWPGALPFAGNAIGGAFDLLEKENEATGQTLLGGKADPERPDLGPLNYANPVMARADWAMRQPDVQAKYRTEGPVAAWDYGAEKYLSGVEKAGYEMASDPLSYLGGWARGAKEIPGIGRHIAPAVSAIEKPLERALGLPFEAALKAGGTVLKGANAAIGAVDGVLPGGGAGARRLADQANEKVSDALGELRAAGITYAQLKQDPAAVYAAVSDQAAGTISGGLVKIQEAAEAAARDRVGFDMLTTAIESAVPAAGPALRAATTADEWLKRARPFLQPADAKVVEQRVQKWSNSGDLFADDPLDLAEGQLHRANAEAVGYLGPMGGVKDVPLLGGVAQGLSKSLSLWKEQVLASPRYVATNLLGGTVMNAMAGTPASQVLKNAGQMAWEPTQELLYAVAKGGANPVAWVRNFRNEARRMMRSGSYDTPKTVQDAMSQYAVPLPHSVGGKDAQVWSNTVESTDPSRTAWDDVPAVVRMGLGALGGSPAGPLGAIGGAVYGAMLPTQTRVVRFLSEIVEGSLRKTAWLSGMDTHTSEVLPAFAQGIVQRLASQAPNPMSLYPPQVMADYVRRAFEATGGRMSTALVEDVLTRAGADHQLVKDGVKAWANVLNEGTQKGAAQAAKPNFNYAQPDNVESALKYTSPFVLWPKRAVPFFVQAMRDNPAIFIALHTLARAEEEETANLPNRFDNTISVPFGQQLARAIYGLEGEVRVNPLAGVSPFGSFGEVSTDRNQIDAAVRTAGNLGLGLGPHVQEGLYQAGVTTRDPRWLRPTGLVEGLTNVNPERTWREAARTAPADGMFPAFTRAAMAQRNPPNSLDSYLVRRRLDEVAVEMFGETAHGEHSDNPVMLRIRAAANDPADPLYIKALAEVRRERAGQAAAGFVLPADISFLGETAGRVAPDVAALPEHHRPIGLEALPHSHTNPQFTRDGQGNLLPRDTHDAFERVARERRLSTTYRGQPPIDADDLLELVSDYKGGDNAAWDESSGWIGGYRAWLRDRDELPKDRKSLPVDLARIRAFLRDDDEEKGRQ